jgi:hypothetical protein
MSPVALATARARLLRMEASLRVECIPGMRVPEAESVEVEVEEDRVRLVEPAEPQAWAVGTEELGVFRSLWHAERLLGPKPVPAALEAHVPQQPSLHVRVFCDDGSVGTWAAPHHGEVPSSPMLNSEEATT